MASFYAINTLPKPRNEAIKLKEVLAKHFAAIRFSDTITQNRLEQEQKILEAFQRQKGLKAISKPTFVFFNPPWTLPFLRRNEVMFEIEK
ncbi:MAG: heme-binding protein [Candidatus Paracaedibacteraceae bacterium]|nr:heme-binding protein [Candidatus Paracaedibacteraceae bacterium]